MPRGIITKGKLRQLQVDKGGNEARVVDGDNVRKQVNYRTGEWRMRKIKNKEISRCQPGTLCLIWMFFCLACKKISDMTTKYTFLIFQSNTMKC